MRRNPEATERSDPELQSKEHQRLNAILQGVVVLFPEWSDHDFQTKERSDCLEIVEEDFR